MSSELKATQEFGLVSQAVLGQNTFTLVFFQLHTKRLGERVQTGLGGAIKPVKWAMGQMPIPMKMFMIARL